MNLKPGNCSSCGASIVWAHSVDREPIALDAEHEERIVLHGDLAIATTTYALHFASCRNPRSIQPTRHTAPSLGDKPADG